MTYPALKGLGPWLMALCVFASVAACSQPVTAGRVDDGAGILSEAFEQNLDAKLKGLEMATTDQVVVVTVKDLDGQDIATYTRNLANRRGIGQVGKVRAPNGQYYRDNGVVILVAPNQTRVRIEVGYGLESVITNELSAKIIADDVVPAFKAGRYETGIDKATNAIVTELRAAHGVASSAALPTTTRRVSLLRPSIEPLFETEASV